jgi:hypothetical protein
MSERSIKRMNQHSMDGAKYFERARKATDVNKARFPIITQVSNMLNKSNYSSATWREPTSKHNHKCPRVQECRINYLIHEGAVLKGGNTHVSNR